MGIYLGFDPGGIDNFGWCVAEVRHPPIMKVINSSIADNAKDAVDAALSGLSLSDISGVGIDSPLLWVAGASRFADDIVRDSIQKLGCQHSAGTVQSINSLRGACLVQGIMTALLIRKKLEGVPITESHPKALLWLLRKATDRYPVSLVTMNDLRDIFEFHEQRHFSDHERDAALGAWSAWKMVSKANGWKDLYTHENSPSLFTPVAPVEYWMPID